MSRRWAWAFVWIALLGLGIRCFRLDLRPMHNDEAVNAIRQAAAWKQEPYRYHPGEHHGPTLYYFSLVTIRLLGVQSFGELDEATLRLTPALAGTVLIPLLWPLRSVIGGAAVGMAALFTALSPALVFYSRNFIHEMLLALFTWILGLAVWHYVKSRKAIWLMLAGAALGLMHATKETFVFPVAALGVAILGVAYWEGGVGAWTRLRRAVALNHLVLGLAVALAVSVTFYTSFFSHWRGPLDALWAYLPWTQRALGDSPHIHPWYFYLERLLGYQRPRGPWWSEATILLWAAVAAVAAIRGTGLHDLPRRWLRGLLLYAAALTLIYTAIPYKTPWCLVGFWHGFVLLAGVGCAVAWRWLAHPGARVVHVALSAATALHLGWQCVQANFVRYADWRNPYVYAQTVPDLLRMVERVQELARVHPEGLRMPVQVSAPRHEYWPLPWYWRTFERIGWYDHFPATVFAPVIVAAAEWDVRWDDRSNRRWLMAGLYEIRPRVFLELYVEVELWKQWLAQRNLAASAGPDASHDSARRQE
ncbi:MAG: TIGR03663 family protein [Verrucomicrobiota bacterium]|nr:TIGR03663 family protein [Limisphaera sp.]MDW8382284.1 TIGR03663 family protein [Verrucomicrobiota bacterium]